MNNQNKQIVKKLQKHDLIDLVNYDLDFIKLNKLKVLELLLTKVTDKKLKDIISLIIKNQDNTIMSKTYNISSYNSKKITLSFKQLINGFVTWGMAYEGSDYWRKLHENIKDFAVIKLLISNNKLYPDE